VKERSSSFHGWSPALPNADVEGLTGVTHPGVWDPVGVIEVIEAAQKAGVSSFHLEIAELGLKLELHRGDDRQIQTRAETTETPISQQQTVPDNVITAPVLGIFYRRSSPETPPLAEEGATVVAGQTIALLEVMKTYHEVQAPAAGTIIAFLVEDGQFVEYGQPIARFTPANAPSGEASR
jgi:acetyl-CoA carboxylase biotin carboxyl carrier protein